MRFRENPTRVWWYDKMAISAKLWSSFDEFLERWRASRSVRMVIEIRMSSMTSEDVTEVDQRSVDVVLDCIKNASLDRFLFYWYAQIAAD